MLEEGMDYEHRIRSDQMQLIPKSWYWPPFSGSGLGNLSRRQRPQRDAALHVRFLKAREIQLSEAGPKVDGILNKIMISLGLDAFWG